MNKSDSRQLRCSTDVDCNETRNLSFTVYFIFWRLVHALTSCANISTRSPEQDFAQSPPSFTGVKLTSREQLVRCYEFFSAQVSRRNLPCQYHLFWAGRLLWVKSWFFDAIVDAILVLGQTEPDSLPFCGGCFVRWKINSYLRFTQTTLDNFFRCEKT